MASIRAGTLTPQQAVIPAAVKPRDYNKKRMHTHPKTQTGQTMATRRHGSPANLVDGKMGRNHSSTSVLLLDVTRSLNTK